MRNVGRRTSGRGADATYLVGVAHRLYSLWPPITSLLHRLHAPLPAILKYQIQYGTTITNSSNRSMLVPRSATFLLSAVSGPAESCATPARHGVYRLIITDQCLFFLVHTSDSARKSAARHSPRAVFKMVEEFGVKITRVRAYETVKYIGKVRVSEGSR